MEIKQDTNTAITGEALLSMIEENAKEVHSKNDNKDDDFVDVNSTDDDFDDFETDDETEDDIEEVDNTKKSKLGKKEYLMFGGMAIAVLVMGAIFYSVFLNDGVTELDSVEKVTPIEQAQLVKDEPSQEPEPLKPIANQKVLDEVEVASKVIQEPLKEVEKLHEIKQPFVKNVEPTVIKISSLNFKAKSADNIGVNQFALIGDKAFLSSDLFERSSFKTEKKEYKAIFGKKERGFLKILDEDIYLSAKQVSENFNFTR